MANSEIKEMMRQYGVRQWEVAEGMKVSEFTLCRKMRHELKQKEKKQVEDIILKISQERWIEEE